MTEATGTSGTAGATDADIRIVRGNPDADELAALVAVLRALSGRGLAGAGEPRRASWQGGHVAPPAASWQRPG